MINYDWTKADPAPILALYRQLDRAWEDATAGYAQTEGRPVACGAGCSECCTTNGQARGFDEVILSLSPGEAVILCRALRKLPEQCQAEIKSRASSLEVVKYIPMASQPLTTYRKCPLLDEMGRCVAYHARPLLCRVYGLPVAGSMPSNYGCQKNRLTDHPAIAPKTEKFDDPDDTTFPDWSHYWGRMIATAMEVRRANQVIDFRLRLLARLSLAQVIASSL